MGDIGTGIGYLCGTCCGWRDADVPSDGSHFRIPKAHPLERQIDEEFMARDYTKDANGRFIRQPTPTSSIMMFPRQQSDESNRSRKRIAPIKPVESIDVGGPERNADPTFRGSIESDPQPSELKLDPLASDVLQNKAPRHSTELADLPTTPG